MTKLEEATRAYETAREAFVTIDAQYNNVGRDRITCLNKLNEAQKALTAVIEEMHKNAPRDSDWARLNRQYKQAMVEHN